MYVTMKRIKLKAPPCERRLAELVSYGGLGTTLILRCWLFPYLGLHLFGGTLIITISVTLADCFLFRIRTTRLHIALKTNIAQECPLAAFGCDDGNRDFWCFHQHEEIGPRAFFFCFLFPCHFIILQQRSVCVSCPVARHKRK